MRHTRRLLCVGFVAASLASCGPSESTPDAFVPPPDAPIAPVDVATPVPDGSSPDATWADAPGPVDMDIRDLQTGVVPTGSPVRCAGVVVTARGDGATSSVLFVQEPTGTPENSGVFVFVDTSPPPPFALPSPGDLVTVEGTVQEFARMGMPGSRTNIDLVTDITVEGAGTIPAPAVVSESDLVFGMPTAEQWEGVLVRVENVTVASRDPFGEFTMTGGLKADDRLFAYAQPFPGDTFTAIVGPMDHDFGTSRILPRDLGDLAGYTAAPPVLTDLAPPTITIGVGMGVTYTVTIDRPAPAGGTTIDLDTTDPLVAAPDTATVTVPEAMTTATFTVTTIAPGGPIDITATLGAVTLLAAITVLPGPDPVLLGIAPDPTNVLAGGGTAILVAQLDRAAPVGGTVLMLSSASPTEVVVPASVTVPAGEAQVGFRVRADATSAVGPISITATTVTGSVNADVNVITAAPAPGAGNLIINEINYDVPPAPANGDANCDGVTPATSGSEDEFVELTNFTDSPLDLTGVTIADAAATRFTFPAFTLGSGESVVVFGGILGTMEGSSPWCTNVDGSHIGDARAFPGAVLGLTNAGDTVTIALGATTLDTRTFGSGTDESETRSPDFIGAFSKHTLAPGHATDRNWTPGTLLTGAPFSAANPTPPPPPPDAGPPDARLPDAGPTPDAPPPTGAVVSVAPATIDLMASGGTGLLTITIDTVAPTGGTVVDIVSDAPAQVAVPAVVTVPEGTASVVIRVRADSAGAASALVSASVGTTAPQSATVNVVTTAGPPAVGDLAYNEIHQDVPTANGDANCDGATNSQSDEFVEIVNLSSRPIQMQTVTIWDQAGFAPAMGAPFSRFTFPAFVLGPGELVVVFGGALGTMTGAQPWCTNVDGAHIGDASAFAGAALGLNNGGDTVYLILGPMATDLQLVTPIVTPATVDDSYTRAPDFTGAFSRHLLAPGHATDRNWTPGTRVNAAPFAAANP